MWLVQELELHPQISVSYLMCFSTFRNTSDLSSLGATFLETVFQEIGLILAPF